MKKILSALLFASAALGGYALELDLKTFTSSAPEMVAPPVFTQTAEGLRIALSSADSIGFWQGGTPVKEGVRYQVKLEVAGAAGLADGADAGAIITWRKSVEFSRDTMIQRDYLDPVSKSGDVLTFERTLTAPEGTKFLEVKCFVKWEKADVTFRKITLEEVAPQGPRPVRVVAAKVYSPSRAGGIAAAKTLLDKIGKEVPKIDLILLPECFADRCAEIGTGKCGEKLPGGPTFDFLSEYAKKLNCYIVCSTHEDDGGRIYNTAVIVDREGKLCGKFRKVHLPTTEIEAGVLPGYEYPVFDLDFGKVGIMICWDNWYGEAARLLRMNGAELLLFPLAGPGAAAYFETTWQARSIDNGLPTVMSSFIPQNAAQIILPDGTIAAESRGDGTYASAEIDLAKGCRSYWLSVGPAMGEGRSLFVRERRESTYGKLSDSKL